MKKRRFPMPSAGVVIGLIALFVALGGTVYAAATLNGKEIKKNTIPANRIKKHSITGTQLNLAKVGKVPTATRADSAANADHATSANSATNADHASSADLATKTSQISGFTYKGQNGDSEVVVLNDFSGLTLLASCQSGANKGITVKAASASPGTISFTSTWQGLTGTGEAGNGNNGYSQISSNPLELYSPTNTTTKITNGGVNIGFAVGTIVYSQPGSTTRVTVNWQYNNAVSTCYWAGTAVASS